jgi:hypothetical protein
MRPQQLGLARSARALALCALMDGIRRHRIGLVEVAHRANSYSLPPEDVCFQDLVRTYRSDFQLSHQGPDYWVYEVVAHPTEPSVHASGSAVLKAAQGRRRCIDGRAWRPRRSAIGFGLGRGLTPGPDKDSVDYSTQDRFCRGIALVRTIGSTRSIVFRNPQGITLHSSR